MAAEMEHRAKGEQFRILDPASFPQKPSKPNLPLLNGIGVMAGLAAGIGLGFFQEFRDQSIHGERDLAYYVPSMLLGCVPLIVTPHSLQAEKRKTRRALMLSSGVGMALTVLLGFMYYSGKLKLDLTGWF